jgi:hypothetical protein
MILFSPHQFNTNMKNILAYLLPVILLAACGRADNRNDAASLPRTFNFEKLQLKTISTVINPAKGTTSTLYGNANALLALRMPDSARAGEKTLVLVTWKQQEDARWFGARIPAGLEMIEVVKTGTAFKDPAQAQYQRYNEKGTAVSATNDEQQQRIGFITSIKPAVMP